MRLFVFFIALLLSSTSYGETLSPLKYRGDKYLRLVTANLYTGIHFEKLFLPPGVKTVEELDLEGSPPDLSPEEWEQYGQKAIHSVFMTMTVNDFGKRAPTLAKILATRRPHVIGLQEVTNLYIDKKKTGQGGLKSLPFEGNYLKALLRELKKYGLHYKVVHKTKHFKIQDIIWKRPDLYLTTYITYENYNVVLVAEHLPVISKASSLYGNMFHLPITDFTPQYPFLPVTINKSWEATDILFNGLPVSLVHTHLESILYFATLQAPELSHALNLRSRERSVIFGDLNSPSLASSPPSNLIYNRHKAYNYLTTEGGYTDAYLDVNDTDTIKQSTGVFGEHLDEDRLLNAHPIGRIDHGLYRSTWPGQIRTVEAEILKIHRTPQGKWPSDHKPVFFSFEIN